MVVGDRQHVHLGEILRRIDIAAGKGAVHEKDGRAVIREHGIDQHALAAKLHIVRRMAEPDQDVLVPGKRRDLRLFRQHRLLRRQPFAVPRQEFYRGGETAFVLRHDLHRLEALELPVHEMGRRLYPRQPRTGGQTPELRLAGEPDAAARRETDSAQKPEKKRSSLHHSLLKTMIRTAKRACVPCGRLFCLSFS